MEKILIIDDSYLQARALKKILMNDYEVTIKTKARAGIECAKTQEYSLILLDIIMPDIDGFEVLKELQQDLFSEHIPIILITSLSDVQNEEKGLVLGAVDYVVKPFHPAIVKARVNTHIRLYNYHKQYKKEALFDELTGIANRRNYEHTSIIKFNEAKRLQIPYTICIIDIDKFKVYNDTFGHPAGDKVLHTVAKTVSSFMKRSVDFFARYGGEEFIIILTGNTAISAYKFIKKIRKAVEDLKLKHNEEVSPYVTISCGGITFTPCKNAKYKDYLQIADNMLYKAKDAGRNKVVWSNNNIETWEEGED